MLVQVCILDCKAYEELMETGEVEAWPNIDNCVILTGSQGKGLLNPGPGEELSDDKKIQIQLQEGEVGLAAVEDWCQPRALYAVLACMPWICKGPSTGQRGLEALCFQDELESAIQLVDGSVLLLT